MSLSPFYSFQSQFVTYLLNHPHNKTSDIKLVSLYSIINVFKAI